MKYDERWNTCGIDRMDMWPRLIGEGFMFQRSAEDEEDLLAPNAVIVTLDVTAPWGEKRTVRIEGAEPPSVIIIDAVIKASYKRAAERGAT